MVWEFLIEKKKSKKYCGMKKSSYICTEIFELFGIVGNSRCCVGWSNRSRER